MSGKSQSPYFTPQKFQGTKAVGIYNPSPYSYYPPPQVGFGTKPMAGYLKDQPYSHCKKTPRDQTDIPLFNITEIQPLPQKGGENVMKLLKKLRSEAKLGNIMVSKREVIHILRSSLKIKNDREIILLIHKAEELDLVHTTKRQFGNVKTLCFVSLKFTVISLEGIMWVLRSLKKDEMTPTERAIQSRIKEAFALKITNPQWERIIESIKNKITRMQSMGMEQKCEAASPHFHNNSMPSKESSSEPEPNFNFSHSYSSSEPNGKALEKITEEVASTPLEFEMYEIQDTIAGAKTFVIFPKNDKWDGIDQKTSLGDVDPNMYKEFKDFMGHYFTTDPKQFWSQFEADSAIIEPPPNSSAADKKYNWPSSVENALTRADSSKMLKQHGEEDEDENKAIPGGRYGCAQFLKTCGPPVLQQCSLGRLAQLVQVAINEDILRYQRTLLVWSASIDKKKLGSTEEEPEKKRHQTEILMHKLQTVKNALIEVLAENRSGVSLAQLPQFLKRKLSFPLDVTELGFGKLKDLILSMDQVKLELRGNNYPFASLKNPDRMFMHAISNSEDYYYNGKISEFMKYKTKRYSGDFNLRNVPNIGYYMNMNSQYNFNQSIVEFNKQLEKIRTALYNLFYEFPTGIESTKIPFLIYAKLGINLDPSLYGCSSLLDFLRKYIMTSYELDIVRINPYEPDLFIVRNKEILMQYTSWQQKCAQPTKEPTYYPEPIHFRFETDPQISLHSQQPGIQQSMIQSSQTQPHSIDLTHFYQAQRHPSTAPSNQPRPNSNSQAPLQTTSPNSILYNFSPEHFYAPNNANSSNKNKKSRSRSNSPIHNRTISFWNISNKSSQDLTALFPPHPSLSSTLNITESNYHSLHSIPGYNYFGPSTGEMEEEQLSQNMLTHNRAASALPQNPSSFGQTIKEKDDIQPHLIRCIEDLMLDADKEIDQKTNEASHQQNPINQPLMGSGSIGGTAVQSNSKSTKQTQQLTQNKIGAVGSPAFVPSNNPNLGAVGSAIKKEEITSHFKAFSDDFTQINKRLGSNSNQ